jgi:hypothetical protein
MLLLPAKLQSEKSLLLRLVPPPRGHLFFAGRSVEREEKGLVSRFGRAKSEVCAGSFHLTERPAFCKFLLMIFARLDTEPRLF